MNFTQKYSDIGYFICFEWCRIYGELSSCTIG